jgi:DNA-binding Lrp family transcriptional regulator
MRALRAYLDLLDAADWMRHELRNQLESFDLTVDGFRLLETLHREGPLTTVELCKRRGCMKQSLVRILRRLEERGWARRELVTLPPAEIDENRMPKRLRGKPRRGRTVGQIGLTPAGRKFMGLVFPRHAKLVFAFMKVLEGREHESMSEMCRKLKEGDAFKLLQELSMEE